MREEIEKMRDFRMRSGMAKFERNCRLAINESGRKVKAWRIPGTKENGRHMMFMAMWRAENEGSDHV